MEKALVEGPTQPWGRVLSWKLKSSAQGQKLGSEKILGSWLLSNQQKSMFFSIIYGI